MTTRDQVDGWLRYSLALHLRDRRAMAIRCRDAFEKDPYRAAAIRLANAHDAAAVCYEKAFGDLEREGELEAVDVPIDDLDELEPKKG